MLDVVTGLKTAITLLEKVCYVRVQINFVNLWHLTVQSYICISLLLKKAHYYVCVNTFSMLDKTK